VLPSHVVGGTGVKVPSINLLIARALPEEDVSSRLVKVEERGAGRHRREAYLDTSVHQEQGRIIEGASLGDVGLIATLRPCAVLGSMANPATAAACVLPVRLVLAVATSAVTPTRTWSLALVLLAGPACAAAR
jgi:hypothetical protein